MKFRSIALPLLALLPVTVTAARPASPDLPHLRLVSSAPAADSVVAPPTELRLTFSEAAQSGATSVHLVDGASRPITLGELKPSADGTVFRAAVEAPLTAGPYTASWRTMATDGHVVKGEINFRVRAADPTE